MKGLSSSRTSLIVGLAVGIMALWAATAPQATSVDSLIGGAWGLTARCDVPCIDDTTDDCDNGPSWTQDDCDPDQDTWVCIVVGPGPFPDTCTGLDYDDCDDGSYDCPGEETDCS